MKLIGRTLAVLAAALVVVGVLLLLGTLSASTAMTASVAAAGAMAGHAMQSGFNWAGIVELLPTLAVVAIVTAIVAPIKQRLLNKRRPSTARRPPLAAPTA